MGWAGAFAPWAGPFCFKPPIYDKRRLLLMCQVINFKSYGSIQVLNRAFDVRWVYIGRASRQAGLPASPLANPFKVAVYGRTRAISRYRRWLWARMQAGDTAVLAALQAIDEQTVLVCWCKPEACHGDVVKAAADWVRSQASS
jgi:hypothetical protein